MTITSFEEFKDLAKRGTFVPVCKEIVADMLTPVSAFLKIAEHSDYAFLLESVEGGEQVGRYSFLGKDPFLILRSRGGKTTVERMGETTETDSPFIATVPEVFSTYAPSLAFAGDASGAPSADPTPSTSLAATTRPSAAAAVAAWTAP